MSALTPEPRVGEVRFVHRSQIVMILVEDWPNSDDSQARSSTRNRETVLADKVEPVHEQRVPEAVERIQRGSGLWQNPRTG